MRLLLLGQIHLCCRTYCQKSAGASVTSTSVTCLCQPALICSQWQFVKRCRRPVTIRQRGSITLPKTVGLIGQPYVYLASQRLKRSTGATPYTLASCLWAFYVACASHYRRYACLTIHHTIKTRERNRGILRSPSTLRGQRSKSMIHDQRGSCQAADAGRFERGEK